MATTELPLPALPEAHHEEPGGIVDWLTTVDHKKIGLLYIFTSFAIFLAGGVLAMVVRLELAQPGLQLFEGNEHAYTWRQRCSAHSHDEELPDLPPARARFTK